MLDIVVRVHCQVFYDPDDDNLVLWCFAFFVFLLSQADKDSLKRLKID